MDGPGDRRLDYRVELPEGEERGVVVTCERHGESEEFEPGHRSVAFYCSRCGVEVEVGLRDPADPWDWGEMC